MRPDNTVIVAKREYLQRIKTKGFWISTLLLPVFILALTVLPALLIGVSETRQTIVVVDETGQVGADFASRANARDGKPKPEQTERGMAVDESQMARFDVRLEDPAADREAQRGDLNRRVLDEEIDAWVWIPRNVLQGDRVEYHARNTSNVFTQDALEDDLSYVVRRARLAAAGLDPERVGELTRPVRLDARRVSEEGSRAGGGVGGMFFAISLFMILYMMMILWGQQVMTSVIEEKGSRIIEVVLSSIKPFELLMGKLVGTCLAGLTQLGLWLATLVVITAPGILASMAVLPQELALPSLTPEMAVHLLLFFILGFFIFSTLYAAIGSAFNNLQEAQQTASFVVIFIVIPVFVMYPIVNDPNSTMATVMSLIPLFAPLLMSLRIVTEMPPYWQILLAYLLCLGFIWGMVWFCARIYRVGILMYGKKPTLKEILRWVRYA